MNNATFIGRLTRDAELKQGQSNPFLTFSIAVDDGKDATLFIDCTHSVKDGSKLVNYMKKGQQVYVRGAVGVRTYQAKDGSTKASMTLRSYEVELLGGKSDAAQQPSPSQVMEQLAKTEQPNDLPF